MKSSMKLALGVALVVLIAGTVATVYAAPVANQDRDQLADQDFTADRDQLRERQQLRDQSTCPNFVDEDGDGICDNCPREEGTGLEEQHRYGWHDHPHEEGEGYWAQHRHGGKS